jgi:hypothetical protein
MRIASKNNKILMAIVHRGLIGIKVLQPFERTPNVRNIIEMV